MGPPGAEPDPACIPLGEAIAPVTSRGTGISEGGGATTGGVQRASLIGQSSEERSYLVDFAPGAEPPGDAVLGGCHRAPATWVEVSPCSIREGEA